MVIADLASDQRWHKKSMVGWEQNDERHFLAQGVKLASDPCTKAELVGAGVKKTLVN